MTTKKTLRDALDHLITELDQFVRIEQTGEMESIDLNVLTGKCSTRTVPIFTPKPVLRMDRAGAVRQACADVMRVASGEDERSAGIAAKRISTVVGDIIATADIVPQPTTESLRELDELIGEIRRERRRLRRSNAVGSRPDGSHGRQGQWFERVTGKALNADTLRKAAERGTLADSQKIAGRWRHSPTEVARVYAEHAAKINAALTAESA